MGPRQLDPKALLKYEYASAPTKAKQIGQMLIGLNSSYLDTFDGLDEIGKIIGGKQSQYSTLENKGKRTNHKLEDKNLKMKFSRQHQPVAAILADFKVKVRPPTPTIEDEEDIEVTQAAILIQKTIRGRAEQARMERGLKINQELINELREQYPLTEEDKSKVLAEELENKDQPLEAEERIDEFLARIEGETLGRMLDYLSFELTHSVITPRAQDILQLNEDEREKRQGEKQEKLYIQIGELTRSTVNLYLDQVLLTTVYKARQYMT